MVKILVCGDIAGQWELLIARVKVLDSSAHGPFHCLFLTGRAFSNIDEFNDVTSKHPFPIPTYFFDLSQIKMSELPTSLPKNLFLLQHLSESTALSTSIGGIVTISQYLTISYLNLHDKSDRYEAASQEEIIKDFTDICSGTSYRGCDLLLSSDWPKDVQYFIDESENEILKESGAGIGIGEPLATKAATICKPRYHFASGRNAFFQRSPYRNEPTEDGRSAFPCTRFVSLATVSDSKDKNKKWLHALSLEPIIHMKTSDILDSPTNATDNPYMDIRKKVITSTAPSFINGPTSLGGNNNNRNSQHPSTFFFGSQGVNPSNNNNNNSSLVLVPPHADAKQLFIGGLSREISERDLIEAIPGAKSVKRPPGKSFAFVNFEMHIMAVKVVEAAAKRGFSIRGRTLTVGWAAGPSNVATAGNASKRTRDDLNESSSSSVILIPPSEAAQTLFIANLPIHNSMSNFEDSELFELLGPDAVAVTRIPNKIAFVFVECSSFAAAEAILTRSQTESGLLFKGNALSVGWAKGKQEEDRHGDNNKRSKRQLLCMESPYTGAKTLFIGGLAASTTDSDIQQLIAQIGGMTANSISIRKPDGKDFAFLEFPSARDAQRVMDQASGGGRDSGIVLHDQLLGIGWAKGRPADALAISSHAGDCWFCLASPTVKVSLIASVGEHSYLALPRGGISDFHALIVPIECVPSRVHLSPAAKEEISKYEAAIGKLFAKENCNILKFERAIRTKGRDHMQINMIPVPKTATAGLHPLTVFTEIVGKFNLKFHEIQGEKDVGDVVVDMEGGPFQEFFYMSIPMGSSGQPRQFVYVHEDDQKQFPMFLGSEITANILSKPERANWKNCLLSEDLEIKNVEAFRSAFEPFDFTQG